MNNNVNEDEERKKYESKYNIYHDKKELNKKSNFVMAIIVIVLVLVTLITILS